MDLLQLEYGGEKLIKNFSEELIFLNGIIGGLNTEEQLKSVKEFLKENKFDLIDVIDAAFIEGIIETNSIEDFKNRMQLLLISIQFPLGEMPIKLRGAGSSPYL